MEPCEGLRGGNKCGRESEFYIEDEITGDSFFACHDCVGVVLVEKEIEDAKVRRSYD